MRPKKFLARGQYTKKKKNLIFFFFFYLNYYFLLKSWVIVFAIKSSHLYNHQVIMISEPIITLMDDKFCCGGGLAGVFEFLEKMVKIVRWTNPRCVWIPWKDGQNCTLNRQFLRNCRGSWSRGRRLLLKEVFLL
jgi:hypothetical protein